MNINFHYAAIKVLARCAGFDEADSQAIAYASQYVDDATAHEPMRLDKNPKVKDIRFENGEFDPICTAHRQLDYLRTVLKQRSRILVYICFHFIPSRYGGATAPTYIRVDADGALARHLVEKAVARLSDSPPMRPRRRALIGLGIALHSYADTWAHQGFSGEWDSINNDIRGLQVCKRADEWERVEPVSQFLSYAMPDIGHAEAGALPDRSETTWRCRPKKRGAAAECNGDVFLTAAEAIFDLIRPAGGGARNWPGTRTRLAACFRSPAERDAFRVDRETAWHRQFPEIAFHYDDTAWFDAALRPHGGFLDLLGDALDLDPENYAVRSSRDYFLFHAEAGLHRKMVMREIGDWLARRNLLRHVADWQPVSGG